MIEVSNAAKQKILDAMQAESAQDMMLRLGIAGKGPYGFRYTLGFVSQGDHEPDDIIIDLGELKVLIDAASAPKLKDSTLDYIDDPQRGGFKVDNPNPMWSDPTAQAVQHVVSNKINPGIAMHGGFVTLLDVKDGVAYVQFGGGCQGCGMVSVTLKDGVEATILQEVPEIQRVLDTTDHADGKNPFYQPGTGGPAPMQGS